MLDHYRLGKMLGFESTGKVNLATHKVTGEKVCLELCCLARTDLTLFQVVVKIVPRFYPPIEVKGVDLPPVASRLASHDMAREKRILREASLVNLLHHPYIREMLEKVVDNHHHYLIFEHAQDSVQLLDYIITHGHFSERLARKVARQIGSALEYCHMNNIVHRGTLYFCACSLLIVFMQTLNSRIS
jgi:serine/threonine protein kinase